MAALIAAFWRTAWYAGAESDEGNNSRRSVDTIECPAFVELHKIPKTGTTSHTRASVFIHRRRLLVAEQRYQATGQLSALGPGLKLARKSLIFNPARGGVEGSGGASSAGRAFRHGSTKIPMTCPRTRLNDAGSSRRHPRSQPPTGNAEFHARRTRAASVSSGLLLAQGDR